MSDTATDNTLAIVLTAVSVGTSQAAADFANAWPLADLPLGEKG